MKTIPTETEARIAAAIEHAEEINHPLQGLIDKAGSDSTAPFYSEVLSCLLDLKREDPAAFERMRAELKRVGVRVSELDRSIARLSCDLRGREPTQVDVLLELAENIELFHSPDGTPYADISVNEHRETWQLQSKGLEHFLKKKFYEETSITPKQDAWRAAIDILEAKARYDSLERDVYVRVGQLDRKIFVDLGDTEWRAIEIGTHSWNIIKNPPVRFRRAPGMLPLPEPEAGGSIDALRPFVNVTNEADFVLVVAWVLGALHYPGPYPLLVLSGEHGTAKSTCASILQHLVDPSSATRQALPREERDVFIAAKNRHVLAFDNLSTLRGWVSDCLCRLSTGGSQASRRYYTNDGEVLFAAQRPVIINGIEDLVRRQDLADRAIFITLQPIEKAHRLPEQKLWSKFKGEQPRILGALLDALAHGLRTLPEIDERELPRMADFALRLMACEGALWPRGTFLNAYARNREEAMEAAIQADQVASAVVALMTVRTMRTTILQGISAREARWEGTASDLLRELDALIDDRARRDKSWPKVPQLLSNRLRRAASFLRERGIEITSTRQGRDRTRIICIVSELDQDEGESLPSTSRVTEFTKPEKIEEAIVTVEETKLKGKNTPSASASTVASCGTSSASSAPSADVNLKPQNTSKPRGYIVPKPKNTVLKPKGYVVPKPQSRDLPN
jgi:hypothetical protein